MNLKTPNFWYNNKTSVLSKIKIWGLTPLSILYGIGHFTRYYSSSSYKSALPVICVGNATAGGSGKTPVAIALYALLKTEQPNKKTVFLTRGYGGRLSGPVLVDPKQHTSEDVGDEALLLAKHGPVIVSANRKLGAQCAEQNGYGLILMDDGLQNPGLKKDLKLLVIDGETGFGNRKLLPAGPLREPLNEAFTKTDAFIIIGNDNRKIKETLPNGKPVFSAHIDIAKNAKYKKTKPYIAFTGIGQPEKFETTLHNASIKLLKFHSFPDHYKFHPDELETLHLEAKANKARLITTEKDAMRLPPEFKSTAPLDILPIELHWKAPAKLKTLLKQTST